MITYEEAYLLDAWAWQLSTRRPEDRHYKQMVWEERQMWFYLQGNHPHIEPRWYARSVYLLQGPEGCELVGKLVNKRPKKSAPKTYPGMETYPGMVEDLLQAFPKDPEFATLSTLCGEIRQDKWDLARRMRRDGVLNQPGDLVGMLGDYWANRDTIKRRLDNE